MTDKELNTKIKIGYAYKGVIYLPLFLAEFYKFLPKNVEVHYTGGDDKAIDRMLYSEKYVIDEYTDFAICDPFYHPDIKKKFSQQHVFSKADQLKKPVVIGCLINNTPIWIYKTDSNIVKPENIHVGNTGDGIVNLNDLLKEKSIRKIRAYPSPNTGFIFGKELQDRFLKQDKKNFPQLEEVNFDPYIEDTIDKGEILLTANLVKVAKNPENIIYAFPTDTDEKTKHLRNLFFTGLITRKDFLNNNLLVTLNIMDALKQGIAKTLELDKEMENNPELFIFLKKIFKGYSHLKSYDDVQLKSFIKELAVIIRKSDLYSKDLTFTFAEWDRMERLRTKKIEGQRSMSFYEYSDLRHANLLNNKWQNTYIEKVAFWIWKISNSNIISVINEFFSKENYFRSLLIVVTGTGLFIANYLLMHGRNGILFYLNLVCVPFIILLGGITFYKYIKSKKDGEAEEFRSSFIGICETVILGLLIAITFHLIASSAN